jgi:pSer/pThr/pTyr-binding forkhead associated (FHA) protein
LLFRDGDDRQQLFSFAPGCASATVGRRSSSDLVLSWDDQISRLHARFERVQSGWELVDDGFSSNGTFVNGERLSGRRRLNDGDTVRFGTTTVTFRSPAPEQASTPDTAHEPQAVTLSTNQRRVLIALCRPYKRQRTSAAPATDEQIADELVLSAAEVRGHLRVLCAKLGVEAPPQAQARLRLAKRALSTGLVSEQDL